VIVADTGAIIALVDSDDRHHETLLQIFEHEQWVLPWAVLPEVDYLLGARVGTRARMLFLQDVAAGAFAIEWGSDRDLDRAAELDHQYEALQIGLVDAAVMAVAERLRARAIATLDLRHFGSVVIRGEPSLLPRDW
jgi:predicted nucleic acid-binding protein